MFRLLASAATARTIATDSSLSESPEMKTAVDLDLVERKAAQVTEGRIAGAEIVHRDMYAEPAQLMERTERLLAVLHEDRLGNLKLEAMGRQPGGGQRIDDHRQQILVHDLNRREIDRELHLVRPASGVGASLAQQPFAERHDQSDLFRHGNEFGGRGRAPLGVMPAQRTWVRTRPYRHS